MKPQPLPRSDYFYRKISYPWLLFMNLSAGFMFLLFSCEKLEVNRVAKIETGQAGNITQTTAEVKGEILDIGETGIIRYGHCWSTDTNPTINLLTKTLKDTLHSRGTFQSHLSALNPNTKYYVKAYMTDAEGTNYSKAVYFYSNSLIKPIVTTSEVTNIIDTAARCGGNVTSDGGAAVASRGISWSKSPDTTATFDQKLGDAGTGAFTVDLGGLTPVTTYYVKAYATNSQGTAYGDKVSFTTSASLPVVTTAEVTSVTSTSALCGGNVTSDGGAAITSRGISWSESPDTTAANVYLPAGSGTSSFSVALTSLTPSTTYYVKAYATNAAGTAFGAKISFTTFSSIPAVLTTAVTFVASDKARCAGNVIYEGDAAIIERGVCWSTSPGPTTANDYAISGSGTGAFTSELNGLPGNTTYYVRAFAINALGTGYGNEISFRTSSNDYTGSLTDIRDNKMYDWVKIGTQVWMADNMALLPSVSPSSGGSITAPYYYVYGYQGESVDGAKNESNYATYGVLYNWLAAMRGAPGSNQNPSGVQGICPDGWHMPSDAEWLELREYLGGYDVAGGKLKESGYAHWSSPNTGADNSSGFTALPGGFRMDDGKFTGIGLGGIWWTSWESGMSIARRYYIGYDQAGIFWNDNTMDNGYSVRCVMDE